MVSKAWTEGFYTKPRIDHDILEEYHEDLICLSACLAGEIPRALLNDDYEEAKRNGDTYFEQVGKILDVSKTEIRYNSEWLKQMNFEDVIRLASKYTVARMLERDDFANRFANKNDNKL